ARSDWRERLLVPLSSGMKRRLEIARALIHHSRVLFREEPTVGLDAQSRERFWQYVHRLRNERELTVIVTTHYIEEVEGCDRVCIIDHGRILAQDAPAKLKSAHGQELVRLVAGDEAARAEVTAAYAELVVRNDTELVLKWSGEAFTEALFARFGSRIRRLAVQEPGLESVFLALTGRELRDQAAGARELTYEFGKRGGEHTK